MEQLELFPETEPTNPKRAFSAWAKHFSTPIHQWGSALFHHEWDAAYELTESEYKLAIRTVETISLR